MFNNQYNVDRFYFVSNLEPSNELDRSNSVASKASQSSASGGITCCVPMCYNNSKRNPGLSFYVIPKDQALRKKWLLMISRKDFKPSISHRVCSAHFTGGRKTYENNIPTIVPKTIKPKQVAPRTSLNSSGLKRKLLSPVKRTSGELEEDISSEETLAREVQLLKQKIVEMEQSNTTEQSNLKSEISTLTSLLEESKFTVDRFKHNKAHFRFYTGFESYDLFKIVLEYLQPAADSLIYWGSNTNIDKPESKGKRGRARALTPEEEFFMVLTRLRCAFPIEDIGVRFNMSTSNVSRILITWIDLEFYPYGHQKKQ